MSYKHSFVFLISLFIAFQTAHARMRVLLIAPNSDHFIAEVNENQGRRFLSNINTSISATNIKKAFLNFIPEFDIVELYGNVKYASIHKSIDDQITNLIPGDSFLVYINTHGFLSKTKRDVFLVTSDTTISNPRETLNFNSLKKYDLSNCISRQEIVDHFKKSNSGISMFLLLDSCYGGHNNILGASRYIPPTDFYYGVSEEFAFFTRKGSCFSISVNEYSKELLSFPVPPSEVSLIDFITETSKKTKELFKYNLYIPKKSNITEKYKNMVLWKPHKQVFVNLWPLKTNAELPHQGPVFTIIQSNIKKKLKGFDAALKYFNQSITEPITVELVFPNARAKDNMQYKDRFGNIFKVNSKDQLYLKPKKLLPVHPYKTWEIDVPEHKLLIDEETIEDDRSVIAKDEHSENINIPNSEFENIPGHYNNKPETSLQTKNNTSNPSQRTDYHGRVAFPTKQKKWIKDSYKLINNPINSGTNYSIAYKATAHEIRCKNIADKTLSVFKTFSTDEGQIEIVKNSLDDQFVYVIFCKKLLENKCKEPDPENCYTWNLIVYNKETRKLVLDYDLGSVLKFVRPRVSNIQFIEDYSDPTNIQTTVVLPLFPRYSKTQKAILIATTDKSGGNRIYNWPFTDIYATELIQLHKPEYKKILCVVTRDNALFYDLSMLPLNNITTAIRKSIPSSINITDQTVIIEKNGNDLYSILKQRKVYYFAFNEKNGKPKFLKRTTSLKGGDIFNAKTPTSASSDGSSGTFLYYNNIPEKDGTFSFYIYDENYIDKTITIHPDIKKIVLDHSKTNRQIRLFIKRIGTYKDFFLYAVYQTKDQIGGQYRLVTYLFTYENNDYNGKGEWYQDLGNVELSVASYYRQYITFPVMNKWENDIYVIKVGY